MKELTGLDINVSVYMEQFGGPNIYQARVRYEEHDSVFEELITFSGRSYKNLSDLFNEITLKVYELEQDKSFGRVKKI